MSELAREEELDAHIVVLRSEYSDWEKRKEAAAALGELGDERALEPLIAVLTDEALDSLPYELDVRFAAHWGLAEMGGPAVQPLIAALKDEREHVRFCAEEALERIGGPEAERALAEYRARQK